MCIMQPIKTFTYENRIVLCEKCKELLDREQPEFDESGKPIIHSVGLKKCEDGRLKCEHLR
ncbi:hypothetical protein UFOVP1138_8 [uncultured Caudovirales phage]|uniref:Uncharacterized protein n=1 Tax=uncultured Caudovirales phage TaxID=2100421 RepID=A0A6J5PXS6_9CAUD|nr:hypothetical protein UFOVP975_23 [uncultured Caudovirales phage]CAB4186124.1 hypothetical protein UFOVP1138_8 [uncultured Caudovirales phage]CAB4204383.1 hypothetical protein UFOVP1394_5 [uncultured Caudovirales phage]